METIVHKIYRLRENKYHIHCPSEHFVEKIYVAAYFYWLYSGSGLMICYTAQKTAVNCLFYPNATSDLPILCVSPQCYGILATFDTMFARQSVTGIEPFYLPLYQNLWANSGREAFSCFCAARATFALNAAVWVMRFLPIGTPKMDN